MGDVTSDLIYVADYGCQVSKAADDTAACSYRRIDSTLVLVIRYWHPHIYEPKNAQKRGWYEIPRLDSSNKGGANRREL